MQAAREAVASFVCVMASLIEPPAGKAHDSLRQEDDHGDENDAERNEIRKLIAEEAREQFAHEMEKSRANYRSDQRPDAAP